MYVFSRTNLGCWIAGLLTCSGTVQAASGMLEVDLVFPQNDTYAPEPIIPVAFAIQHPELARNLKPSISFSIIPYGTGNHSIANGYYDLTWANFTSSDPYMEYGESLEGLNTEGTWLLDWTLSVDTCYLSDGKVHGGIDSYRRQLVFTTQNGAKRPDLTAATSDDTCANSQGTIVNITQTLDTAERLQNGTSCVVLSETTSTSSPCGVHIEASAASSVSASLTNRACAVQTASWCPKPVKKGAAGRLMAPSLVVSGVVFLVVVFGGWFLVFHSFCLRVFC